MDWLTHLKDVLPLGLAMLATGVVGGLLAGLLGVGGGIVIVPVLDLALGMLGVDPAVRMKVAIATSMATIIPTSLSSSRAHRARGAVDTDLVARWAAALLIGSIAGVAIAARASGALLSGVFGVVALIVALKMLLPLQGRNLASAVPTGVGGQAMPVAIGGVSSMMGIGGGTLSVPLLTLFGQPVHRAVGTASLFGLLISVPATLAFILTGWRVEALPVGSLGYVNLLGFAIIAPVTTAFAPLGARIAHGFSQRQLSMAFGVFLLIVSIRMLGRTFG